MKGLLISIFTFIIVWALYGVFFNDFEENILFLTIVGCRRQVEFYTFCSFPFYTSAEKMLFR
ncbi:hypothetical protein, partial [Anaerobacillus sp. 1_MG-2023]|uniref:hypothetical protein n=1 Tax=Anaerobacillus sp. 1_MG-2023 TaxID=3062655 RepID=UPI0026E33F7C